MTEEEDKKYKQAIIRLSSSAESWSKIRSYLLEEIRLYSDIISDIDKIVQERQDKFSKLN